MQEAEKKIQILSSFQPHPVWHMIGHLQSNKVKPALAVFNIIQGVDSVSLAKAINLRAQEKISILLEVNVAGELTKSGFALNYVRPAFDAIRNLPNIEVKGLMTIAPPVDDAELVRPVFRKLRQLRDEFHLEHLSMGMTDDFEVAIEQGSTMIRIGRGIFGERV